MRSPASDMATVVSWSQLNYLRAVYPTWARVLKDLKLPSWAPATRPVWPPYRPIDFAMVAPRVGGDPRLHTDRWWEPWEERARRAD